MNPTNAILPLSETVTPADPAAVADVLRGACQRGTPVYPIGGGTSLDYGTRPTKPGLGLSLAGLDRVIDYPARDLTITAEAGVTIADLTNRLASEGQRLPVDVAEADRATLGGVVATSPSGPRRYLWGTMRDYVIGLGAVDGRGTPFSGGGRVVKNAAGYDLCRLLTGSLGTLGLLTQVTLMVKPIPEASALVACDVADFDAAEKLLARLVHTSTLPAAIELLLGPAWQDDSAFESASNSGIARLVVGFEGRRSEVDWMVGQLLEDWRAAGVSSPAAISNSRQEALWKRLAEFPAENSAPAGSSSVVVEIGVLPSAVVDCLRLLVELDPNCSIQVHGGDGIIRARFSLEANEVAGLLNGRLRSAVTATRGRMVVLSYPLECKLDQQTVWGPPGDGAKIMQTIKRQFDPEGILNPGRFVY